MLFGCIKNNPSRNDSLIGQPLSLPSTTNKIDKHVLKRWKQSVIHLEGVVDSKTVEEKIKEAKNKSFEEQSNIWSSNLNDIRYRGTAIFMENEGKYYLLTARHVVFDELSAKRNFKEEVERLNRFRSAAISDEDIKRAELGALNTIYKKIFRVKSFDELSNNKVEIDNFLFLLWENEYTFSIPDLDLAIISLNSSKNRRLADELIKLGYKPISMSDIEDQPSEEGSDVFTVGYPEATAVLGQLNNNKAVTNWSSDSISIPTFVFGKVSMLNDKIAFFLTDLSVYPGNSGGPVIENGKLVGIVSQQSRILLEDLQHDNKPLPFGIRIPFGRIIKAKYIKPLLDLQIKKEKDGSFQ